MLIIKLFHLDELKLVLTSEGRNKVAKSKKKVKSKKVKFENIELEFKSPFFKPPLQVQKCPYCQGTGKILVDTENEIRYSGV